MNKLLFIAKKNYAEIILTILALLFSFWLMFHTFSYKEGQMLIASKAWSDFSSQIPLIRSFSFGLNFPPQYPLFAREPIHYHFLFYAFVGMLERANIPLDYALNIPSALGFSLLIVLIYTFANNLFHSKTTALLSILFFLFNGTLSFIYFFSKHPLSLNTPSEIISNAKFPSFGPYDAGLVSAFWNLNIYTNQRHLAASYAFAVLILLIFLFILPKLNNKRKSIAVIALGVSLGLFFYFHLAILLAATVSLFLLAIINKRLKEGLTIFVIAGIICFPQYLYLSHGSLAYSVKFHPGYLVANNLTFVSFFLHWIANLGLHIVLIPLGVFFSDKKQRFVFLAVLSIFIIGNLFQFSPEIAGNHKFINYFMLFGVMFTAYAILKLWTKEILPKPIIVSIVFFLIFSGIIDFFPVYNDKKGAILDYQRDPTVRWIIKNTKPDAVFLNSSYLYTPESLAGRKIMMGWPYFAWSAGYDVESRGKFIEQVFSLSEKKTACKFLSSQNIDYIRITNPPDPSFPKINQDLLAKFKRIYNDTNTQTVIYDVKENCRDT